MSNVVIITGASKGIGLATATRFQQQGFRVINISRSECPLEGARNIAADLAETDWKAKHGKSIIDALFDSQGDNEPDTENDKIEQLVLVHNAARMTKETVSDIDGDVLRSVLQLNVVAPAELNTLLLPHMSAGSSILYISSTLGRKAVANTHAYVISKHAVIGQMRATCQDLAGSMIHTAAVCPGFTETEMLSEHLGKNPEIYQHIVGNIAHRRLAQPSEIAETLWFCADNPVINGAIIDANLGQIET